jgi:hypothetical protein
MKHHPCDWEFLPKDTRGFYFLVRLDLERVEFAGVFLDPLALRAGVVLAWGVFALGRNLVVL